MAVNLENPLNVDESQINVLKDIRSHAETISEDNELDDITRYLILRILLQNMDGMVMMMKIMNHMNTNLQRSLRVVTILVGM